MNRVLKAARDHAVVQVAEGESRDEGDAELGGDQALSGPVIIGLDFPAGNESGLAEGTNRTLSDSTVLLNDSVETFACASPT
jgi:hypothetical protein